MRRADLDAVLHHHPLTFAQDVLHFRPEPYQAQLLQPHIKKALLCCHRGAGKTEIIAVRAAHHCATNPKALVLVASETAEKAAELIQRTVDHLAQAKIEVRKDKLRKHGVTLANGARLLPMPARPGAVRGYPATMVVIDEAACVPDAVYTALRGTRAAHSQSATFWIMSTPGPRRGFFYQLWTDPDPHQYWTRLHLSAENSPRITPQFLAEERHQMHPADFNREYLAQFGDTRTTLFRDDDIRHAIHPAIPALGATQDIPYFKQNVLFNDGTSLPDRGFFFSLDLGQSPDQSTLAVIDYQLTSLGTRDPIYWTIHHAMHLRLRWLQVFPRETPYSDIGPILAQHLENPEVQGRAHIIVDATGVGRAFYDQLKLGLKKASITGVQITAGTQVTHSGSLMNIPKQEIVLNLETLLRDGTLQLSAHTPHLKDLVTQLQAFERIALPGGRYAYSGKTSGGDDLVMALALGVSYAYQRYGSAFRRKT